jgi:hypothetical protein
MTLHSPAPDPAAGKKKEPENEDRQSIHPRRRHR